MEKGMRSRHDCAARPHSTGGRRALPWVLRGQSGGNAVSPSPPAPPAQVQGTEVLSRVGRRYIDSPSRSESRDDTWMLDRTMARVQTVLISWGSQDTSSRGIDDGDAVGADAWDETRRGSRAELEPKEVDRRGRDHSRPGGRARNRGLPDP